MARKIVLASKAAKVPYLVSIGGTGSLYLAGQGQLTACDDPRFWVAFRRSVADSEQGIAMMDFRSAQIGAFLRRYRDARLAVKSGNASDEQTQFVAEFEDGILAQGNDAPGDLPTAARATFSFYEGQESFRWTFVSPPAQYRPGKRTGLYQVHFDEVPLLSEEHAEADNVYAGRLMGISAADLAIAIADEVEKQKKVGRHWSATAELSDDFSAPNVATLP
jgi:putative NADH-flavin reductase